MRRSAYTRRLCVLGALVASASMLALAAGSASATTWAPCDVAIENIDCATFDMPLDRTGVLPGITKVRAIKMAAAEGPRMGTMFVIAGGPGQTSYVMLELMATLFAGANRYDLIAVDQRGSGMSEPLDCPRLEDGAYSWDGGDPKTDSVFTECSNSLGPARATYNTAEAVADLDDIRTDLGVDKATFFGVSYGTKVALAYAKAHPANTKALLLDSVLPTDMPAQFDTDSVTAARGALADICAGSRCAKIGGSAVANVAKLSARLDRNPIPTFLVSSTAKITETKIDADALYNIIFQADFNPFIYSQLPATLSSALRRNSAPLERLFATVYGAAGASATRAGAQKIARSLPKQRAGKRALPKPGSKVSGRSTADIGMFSYTMLYATSCADLNPPWTRGPDLAGRQDAIVAAANAIPDASFYPFTRTTVRDNSLASFCRGWQQSETAPAIPQGPLPDVPTLALDGSLDLRTPVSWAERGVAGDPSAQVVKIPNTGHSTIGTDLSGCALSLAKRFLVFGATDGKCKKTAPALPVAARAATSLGGVKPLPGRCKGIRGAACVKARKRLTAGYEGLRDALDQMLIGGMDTGQGIYFGFWSLDYDIDGSFNLVPSELSMLAMSSVPGSAISGRIDLFELPRVEGRVTITGFRRAEIGGRVAFNRASDSLSITGRTKRGLVTVRVKPTKKVAASAVATRTRLAQRRTWALATTPPQGRIVP